MLCKAQSIKWSTLRELYVTPVMVLDVRKTQLRLNVGHAEARAFCTTNQVLSM